MYTTLKNVPVPTVAATRAGGHRARKYPLDTMEVGEMFFVAHRTKNNLTTHVSAVGKKLGRSFATRLVYMRATSTAPDKWELCGPDDDGAVQGIGVWRRA